MNFTIQEIIDNLEKSNIIEGTEENIAVFFDNIIYLTEHIIKHEDYSLIMYIHKNINFDIDISGYNELLIGSIDEICLKNPEKFISFVFPYYMEGVDKSPEIKTLFTNLLWNENYTNLLKSQFSKHNSEFIEETKQKLLLLNEELGQEQVQYNHIIPWLKNLKILL